MLKRLAAMAAVLALVLVASVSALAQLPDDFYTVDCSDLHPGIMPMDCAVDEDGLIVLPDGTKAPYTVADGPLRVQGGDLFPVPETGRDSAGSLQYNPLPNPENP